MLERIISKSFPGSGRSMTSACASSRARSTPLSVRTAPARARDQDHHRHLPARLGRSLSTAAAAVPRAIATASPPASTSSARRSRSSRKARIAENIMLDKMITRGRTGIVDWQAVNRVARRVYGNGRPGPPADHRDQAPERGPQAARPDRQGPRREARVLLLDEPTSSLTRARGRQSLRHPARTAGQGRDHHLRLATSSKRSSACATRSASCATAATWGRGRSSELTKAELIKMMIGRECNESHLGKLDVESRARDAAGGAHRPARKGRRCQLCCLRGRDPRLLRPRRGRPDGTGPGPDRRGQAGFAGRLSSAARRPRIRSVADSL